MAKSGRFTVSFLAAVVILVPAAALLLFRHRAALPAGLESTPGAAQAAAFESQIQPLLAKYCIGCHGPAKKKAELDLTIFKNEASIAGARKTWKKVWDQIQAREMPPADKKQPAVEEREFLANWIEGALDRVNAAAPPDPGRVVIRRLNRVEYRNTIRDLLGVDFNPVEDFPHDDVGYGFDNIGDVLSLPPILMEKYFAAAEKILDKAIVGADKLKPRSKRLNADAMQGAYMGSAESGMRILFANGEVSGTVDLAQSGQYLLRVRACGDQAGPDPVRMTLRIDQQETKPIDVPATRAKPQIYEEKATLAAGKHRVTAYPPGTYVVRLDQPYRNYAVDLLTPQHYPKDGGEPYDDVSWELPAYYHLEVTPVSDPAIRAAPVTRLDEAPHPHGRVTGTGAVYLLKDSGQEGLLEARYRLARFKVDIAERGFVQSGKDFPAGSWIIRAQADLPAALRTVAEQMGLDFEGATAPDVRSHPAPVPRLGVWVPWADTDSIGWVRYVLDQRGIPYIYVRDEDIRSGKLRDKIDVLLYGHVDLELAEQIQGIPRAWGPMSFKKSPQFPALGSPAESDDITGGIGWSGLAQLQDFVERGGLLVTLGNGSMLPIEGGMLRGVRRDSGGVPRSSAGGGAAAAAASQDAVTRTPGAHVRVSFTRPDHPLAYGYPASTVVFRQNFALYATPRRWLRMAYCTSCLDGPTDARSVVLQWGGPGSAPFVVSGQAWGEDNLIGRPAVIDAPVGKGHIIAFNFNPLYRDLNVGDQRMVWNAILNWRAILADRSAAPSVQ